MTDQQGIPFSPEAEEAVLGAILTNPTVYYNVAAFLREQDFFLLRHQWIWHAIQRIAERNEEFDYLTVAEELSNLGHLDEVGSLPYLLRLVNNTPSSVHAEVYGHLVERASVRRRLLDAAEQIKGVALDEELAIERVVEEAESRLFNVTESQTRKDLIPIRQAVSEYFDRISHLMANQDQALGLPTGFRGIDTLLGGLQRSDLLIFAGRPGMGKTSFMLSVVLNAARFGSRIAIFTMEMGIEQITQRLISMETGINMQMLRLGQVSPGEESRLVEAMGRLGEFQVFIDDTPALTPLQLRTKTRRMAREVGVDLIIVDYMQLMNAGGLYENNRVQEISYISRHLKELARELNVPLLSAAQLSRAVEQRQDKRPQLSDLRESGCLDGDTLIYRPDTGGYTPIRELAGQQGFQVMSLNTETWKLETAVVSRAFCTGHQPVYRLTTRLGRTLRATGNHKFLTIDGWQRLDTLAVGAQIAIPAVLQHQTPPLNPLPASEEGTSVVASALSCALPSRIMGKSGATRGLNPLPQQPKCPSFTQELPLLTGEGLGMGVQSQVRYAGAARLAPTSDVYWDQIASIEPDGATDVYDLTVPGNHNFVANDIVAHNSIEQDADIVMFLYRDEVYNEATEFPNQADVIVAKHRNGPTGVVSLFFDKKITRFLDATAQNIDLRRS
jgi:replicative DNA helicase